MMEKNLPKKQEHLTGFFVYPNAQRPIIFYPDLALACSFLMIQGGEYYGM
jgi:hypothetical protein